MKEQETFLTLQEHDDDDDDDDDVEKFSKCFSSDMHCPVKAMGSHASHSPVCSVPYNAQVYENFVMKALRINEFCGRGYDLL